MQSILLVEDEPVTAMEVEASEPDLLIVDIRLLGDEDEINIVETVQMDWSIPVVYLTAHSDEETLKRARQTRPCGYLIKPVTREDLKSTIEMAIREDGN